MHGGLDGKRKEKYNNGGTHVSVEIPDRPKKVTTRRERAAN